MWGRLLYLKILHSTFCLGHTIIILSDGSPNWVKLFRRLQCQLIEFLLGHHYNNPSVLPPLAFPPLLQNFVYSAVQNNSIFKLNVSSISLWVTQQSKNREARRKKKTKRIFSFHVNLNVIGFLAMCVCINRFSTCVTFNTHADEGKAGYSLKFSREGWCIQKLLYQ